jgi:protein TonB
VNSTGKFEEVNIISQPDILVKEEPFNEEITQSLQYPPIARENGEEGFNIVEATIDEAGKLSEIKIIKGLSKTLDEESLRIFKLVSDKGVEPYIYMGKPMKFKIQKKISYRLQ